MIRFGVVSEMGKDENLGYARVYFDDLDIVSTWLALPSISTKTAKQWIPVEVNSQVVCIMDGDSEQGFIAMVLWSDTDTPPDWASEDTIGIKFFDGAEIYYDSKAHTMICNAPDSELNFKCKKMNIEGEVNITGDTSVTGEIVATKEVTAGAMKIALTKHKHPTPAGVSGTPTP